MGRSYTYYLFALWADAPLDFPFYPSPMADFGYDIADYCNIDGIFGTLDDFDRFAREAHRRGLKIILDFVPNHTSDQHPWFIESRSSRHSPKRDWYLWRDAKPDGGPPTNWMSNFGGSGWEWDAHTRQYYYHSFLKQQPDLNWRNAAVREAMLDVMRFWFWIGASTVFASMSSGCSSRMIDIETIRAIPPIEHMNRPKMHFCRCTPPIGRRYTT